MPNDADCLDILSLPEFEERARRCMTPMAYEYVASGAADEHTVRWHSAYRDFGIKPRVARPSVDALVRRAASDNGLPRINALVDLYNAVSILHRVPIGGEDLDRYDGSARLTLATGIEPFNTIADGVAVVDHADPGEPVWIDDAGITCRRWNWRQGTRTWLTETTRDAYFLLEALAPAVGDPLEAATEDLVTLLRRWSPDTVIATATLSADTPEETITVGATASVRSTAARMPSVVVAGSTEVVTVIAVRTAVPASVSTMSHFASTGSDS